MVTKILEISQSRKVSSAAGRGLLGGLLFGPLGAVGGMLTSKKKCDITFLVIEDGGLKHSETVREGSKRYKELMQYLEE